MISTCSYRVRQAGGIFGATLVLTFACMETPAQTTEDKLAVVTKERDAKIAENKALKEELAIRKSVEATSSNVLNEISRKLAAATNAITRPIRIPEDIRYLSDFVLGESVVVENGAVHTVSWPLLNNLAAPFGGTLVCADTSSPISLGAKLAQIEAGAGLPTVETNTTIRIARLYRELQVQDWNFERIRFGATMFYNDKLDGLGATITLRAYPAYSRYMDGRFNDFENGVWRRLSLQAGIGGMLSRDDEKADSSGLVANLGIGWDIVHGVTLFAGRSYFTYSKPGVDGDEMDNESVYGITLNSEFWEKLVAK